ncbi:hypothetical protein F4780DRAFT_758173 [Xylariomycetidae sp. FL0641]|nr:hypothetical protein F4780DRAFT_758173 [Xylariomycetidae sp. FL0641]
MAMAAPSMMPFAFLRPFFLFVTNNCLPHLISQRRALHSGCVSPPPVVHHRPASPTFCFASSYHLLMPMYIT